MPQNKKKRVYLSGPITHYHLTNRMDECRAIFQKAEENLKALGYEVVNPMNNGLDESAPWVRHIIVDLDLLDTCGSICYLHTWDLAYSGGSQIEKIAARHNKLVEIREVKNDNVYSYIFI